MRFIFPCADPFFSRGFRGSAHPQAQVDKFQVWVSRWTLKKCGNGKSFNSQLKKKNPFLDVESPSILNSFPSHPTAPQQKSQKELPPSLPIQGQHQAGGGKKGNIGNLRIREAQNTTFLGGEGINFGSIPCFRFGWKSPILLLGWQL